MGLIRLAQLFFKLLFFTAISLKGNCSNKIPTILKIIPKEDQQILKDLFHLLFRHGDFAYAFLGIKPMSSIDYTMQYIRKFPENESFIRETHLARKGFQVWKKYQELLPMQDLVLLVEESDQYEGHFAFILINPQKCLPIIEQHLSQFQNYYGQKLSANELLKCLCQGSFFQKGKMDPIVFGLLLGYPEKDVLAFSNQLKKVYSTKNENSLRPCYLASSKNPLSPIRTPFFMTNRNEAELEDIKSEYSIKKKELINIYYSDDFLENILHRFM